jgi:hypothetical protein
VQQLLSLRLKTLQADVRKVATAVELARGRDARLAEALLLIGRSGPEDILTPLSRLSSLVHNLTDLFDTRSDITSEFENAEGAEPGAVLLEHLKKAPLALEFIKTRILEARKKLELINQSMVILGTERSQLDDSLEKRCTVLFEDLKTLEKSVRVAQEADQPALWTEYETLLHNEAQPLFHEYVDFLGGLTLRDTGLDDRVCEMTEVLLRGFAKVVAEMVPIPAAQAALSTAMYSVVKLGFPEWTVWGVPLVAHEVGVALCQDMNAKELQALLAKWGSEEKRLTPAEVIDLVGHVFAAYTMGPAYGCAALLLRLEPHRGSDDSALLIQDPGAAEASATANENEQSSKPTSDTPVPAWSRTPVRDLDRARLITSVLAETGPNEDSGFAETVGTLRHLWNGTAQALATTMPATTMDGTAAPPAVLDWLDDFQGDVVSALRKLGVRPFTDSGWHEVQQRSATITRAAQQRPPTIAGEMNSPLQETPDDLLKVLNAVWSIRLQGKSEPKDLANEAIGLWEQRRHPAQSPSYMQRRPA